MRSLIFSIVLFGFPLLSFAQETGMVATFTTALTLMKEAQAETSPAARSASFRAALKRFDTVLEETPDLYPAQANAAYCVAQLGELATEPEERRALFADAKRRYEAATKLPKAEARIFSAWAGLLINEANSITEPAPRRELLTKAMQIVKAGLARADSKGERGRLLYQIGRGELILAQVTTERSSRNALYESALEHFKSASEVDAVAKQPQLYASWGIVLLELSRPRNDRMLIMQAVDRLQTALEWDERNLPVRYNLVCAYALLGQTRVALRNLQICLENDDAKRTYFNAALQDPDLNSMRTMPEFNAIFGAEARERPLSPFEKPLLSDK